MKEMLLSKAEERYQALYTAVANYQDKALEKSLKETELSAKRHHLLASGVIDGKNAEIREGQLHEYLEEDYAALHLLEEELQVCYSAKVLADILVNEVTTLVKILSL